MIGSQELNLPGGGDEDGEYGSNKGISIRFPVPDFQGGIRQILLVFQDPFQHPEGIGLLPLITKDTDGGKGQGQHQGNQQHIDQDEFFSQLFNQSPAPPVCSLPFGWFRWKPGNQGK